ncbi:MULTISPECIES: sensor histidine kinase [Bacillales]|uniref:histidine kinase n=1 Tax=Lysinibacillus louembei TaxID=1470088 RepID=A0ABZ0S159_9BACI|nr:MULTISPECIES: sensor histidine kinase [Bacillales]MCT6924334.1 sensor histidine kinase [Metasolibacillus sp.]MCT6940579.1 sensor histidine kinase [Metasolibacillus sp.]WPK13201.1 sensor histidine kinase [Lysinibacillus louembei]
MIQLFLRQHMLWISFFMGMLFIWNVICMLDIGFASISVSYLNSIAILVLIIFLTARYYWERPSLKQLLHQNLLQNVEGARWDFYTRQVIELYEEQKQRQVQLVQKIKFDKEEEQDELLAWVHEIKAPLTAMKLMIEQLEDYKARNRLEQEWLRLHLLVDQQLHQTRLQTLAEDNRLEQVQLRSIVFKEIREFQTWCMEKGIGFQIDELEEVVLTDAKWLGFILRQILSNAIKYSPHHSEIVVSVAYDAQGHALLKIKDVGQGIRAEDLPRIFKKSYTGTIGRETNVATGMGLYLAKRAATALGIQLYVDSIYGKGTTVVLQFPIENEYVQTFGM